MNLWKENQTKEIQIGGWKCPCCTPFYRGTLARDKQQLRKRTRKRIQDLTKKEINCEN
jgi:hypothetical protein